MAATVAADGVVTADVPSRPPTLREVVEPLEELLCVPSERPFAAACLLEACRLLEAAHDGLAGRRPPAEETLADQDRCVCVCV
jgi:hypothetical protein